MAKEPIKPIEMNQLLRPTLLKASISLSRWTLATKLILAMLDAILATRVGQSMKATETYQRMRKSEALESTALLPAMALFIIRILRHRETVAFMQKIYGRDFLIPGFWDDLMGFQAELQLAFRLASGEITEGEMAHFFNRYPRYALNQIKGWKQPSKNMWDRWGKIEEFLEPGNGWLLDVGCGVFFMRPLWRTLGYWPVGIDLSRFCLLGAKILSKESIDVVDGSAAFLPVGDHSLKVIIASELLEHTFDPIEVLLEFRRVLKREGVLIVTIPIGHPRNDGPAHQEWSESHRRNLAESAYGQLLRIEQNSLKGVDPSDPTHVHMLVPNSIEFREKSLAHLFEKAGFWIEARNLIDVVCIKARPQDADIPTRNG